MAEFLSRRDVDFLLYEWLDVVELTKRDHFAEHSRDTFDAVLDLSADIATKCFAPHNKKGDQSEPSVGPDGKVVLIDEIKHALDTFSEAGLLAGSFDEAVGGMQLPTVVAQASTRVLPGRQPQHHLVRLPDRRQRQPAGRIRHRGADRHLGPTDARGPLLRHHVPVGTRCRLVAGRHHDQGRSRRRRHLSHHRNQDVDHRR